MSRLNFLIFCLGIILLSLSCFIYLGNEGYDLSKELLDEYITSLNIEVNDVGRLEEEINKLFETGKFIDFIGRSYYIFVFTFVLGISSLFYILHLYVDYYFFVKNKFIPMRFILATRRSIYVFLLMSLYFTNKVYILPMEFNVGLILILLVVEVFFLTFRTNTENVVDKTI